MNAIFFILKYDSLTNLLKKALFVASIKSLPGVAPTEKLFVITVMKEFPTCRFLTTAFSQSDEEIRVTTYKGNVRTDEIHPKWELVGTHTGRRTFIVTTLSLGIPPNIVMKWTGHSDYKSMKPYIDIVEEK